MAVAFVLSRYGGDDVVNSSNALPQFTITGPSVTASPSVVQTPSAANSYTWWFGWNTSGAAAGTYTVVVKSLLSGQTLKTFSIVLF